MHSIAYSSIVWIIIAWIKRAHSIQSIQYPSIPFWTFTHQQDQKCRAHIILMDIAWNVNKTYLWKVLYVVMAWTCKSINTRVKALEMNPLLCWMSTFISERQKHHCTSVFYHSITIRGTSTCIDQEWQWNGSEIQMQGLRNIQKTFKTEPKSCSLWHYICQFEFTATFRLLWIPAINAGP